MNVLFQLIWIFMALIAPGSISLISCSHIYHDESLIIIDETGIGSAECCVYGKCYCSNLSLALQSIQNNTIIRMISSVSLQSLQQFEATNDTNFTMTVFKNLTHVHDALFVPWFREFMLQFTFIITDCLSNLYGTALVCCDDHSCDERYEYLVDSTHHNVTMISNDIIANCSGSKECTLQVISTASINNGLIFIQIDIKDQLSDKYVGDCSNSIAYFSTLPFWNNRTIECLLLSCNFSKYSHFPKGIHCFNDYYEDNYFTVLPGYWFSNGFTKYVDTCPQGHCNSSFNLYGSIYYAKASNVSYPTDDSQCLSNWTGLACGNCRCHHKDACNYIIHDSTRCAPSKDCTHKDSSGVVVFFFTSVSYWIVIISFIFVLLHLKLDITAGHAYGILFYFSVLEQTVTASYIGTSNNLNFTPMINIMKILSSIGNMKPPLHWLKLCFWENAKMMDHMFLTYIHPIIVTLLIATIFILARKFVIVARTVGRYVNSKSICILLMLSYSSLSYTSVQLLRPLAINDGIDGGISSWNLYLSPTVKYFDEHHKYMIAYFIITILCEVIIGIGFPFVLLFERHLIHYCNINFTSIKPIMDQFKGCYKEEYNWFAAYYLLCRQVIYAVDIGTDFAPDIKFPVMLTVYALIVMGHIGFQPYKERKLNVLDSCILMTLMIVYIGEHITYSATIILWILPLVLFINCVALSTKFKYILIPVSCLAMITLCILTSMVFYQSLDDKIFYDDIVDDDDDNYINSSILQNTTGIILLISFFVLLVYVIYICILFIKRCCRHQPQALAPHYRLFNINEQNLDSYEDNPCDSNQPFPAENEQLESQQYYETFPLK